MKAASLKEIKQELKGASQENLINLCLHLSKFKKENKELLTYLLYDASNEAGYIENVKEEIDIQFELINTKSYHFIKKSIRKILRIIKKYIRYSKRKDTETELLMYFCLKLKNMTPSMNKNTVLINIYERQLQLINKAINTLHEDLQYDFKKGLEELSL